MRGIERRKIFSDDQDRENLIERLSLLLPETGTRCYAWAFFRIMLISFFKVVPQGCPHS
jgi:hypothetical protein